MSHFPRFDRRRNCPTPSASAAAFLLLGSGDRKLQTDRICEDAGEAEIVALEEVAAFYGQHARPRVEAPKIFPSRSSSIPAQ